MAKGMGGDEQPKNGRWRVDNTFDIYRAIWTGRMPGRLGRPPPAASNPRNFGMEITFLKREQEECASRTEKSPKSTDSKRNFNWIGLFGRQSK